MTASGDRSRDLRAPLLLGALLLVALAIRVAVLDVPGHGGDVLVVSRWAERMADLGPLRFYDDNGSIYPALLYVYWPLGAAFDGRELDLAIKALAIPFDLGVGVILAAMVIPRAGWWAGLGAAALYLLNPAVILAGPVWGQIDAAGTLVLLAALWAAAAGRLGLAAGLAVAAGLVKPQFGLALLPVIVLAGLEWRRGGGPAALINVASGALAAYLLIAAPLLLDPIQHVRNIGNVTDIRPEASVLAPNVWALAVGYDTPDTPLMAAVGGMLLVAGLLAAQLPLRRAGDLRTLLAVGVFVVFAFYFLPTRVHERYLFPAMALIAPLAAVSRPVLAAYLAMTAGFTLSLLYALVAITPFELPQDWEAVLITPQMVVALSVVMILAALTLVWQLATGCGSRLADGAGLRHERRTRNGPM